MEKLRNCHGKIKDHDTFHKFLKCLLHDLDSNKDDWENRTLEEYLRSLESWVGDMDGYYTNMGRESEFQEMTSQSWRVFLLNACKTFHGGLRSSQGNGHMS